MQNEGQKTMQNDEQAIRELVATWLSASEAGDTEKVLTLMADDVVFLGPGHPPTKGKAAFAAAQAGLADIDLEATGETQEIKLLGEWAYLWNKLDIVMTPKKGGTPVKRAGDTLSILHKQNGRWVLFRDATCWRRLSRKVPGSGIPAHFKRVSYQRDLGVECESRQP